MKTTGDAAAPPPELKQRFVSGDDMMFRLKGLRLSIPHPDKPGQFILFTPEDVTILFHPDFWPEAAVPAASANP